MNTHVGTMAFGPGESLCGLEKLLRAGSVETPSWQDNVCYQEDKSLWTCRVFVGQMKARSCCVPGPMGLGQREKENL